MLGISGGVDSTTAGRLCQLAVDAAAAAGHEARFHAMRLPYGVQARRDDAQRAHCVHPRPTRTLTVDIRPPSEPRSRPPGRRAQLPRTRRHQDFVLGNIKARQRMVAQYAIAGARRGLVIGTDHAAEALMGFFTKFGDGGADILPLSGLTKRRVRALARSLGAPERLV